MSLKLKVLTLNCWGVFVPFGSQHRKERIDAISSELSKGEYDIVILEEIWTQSDYEKLCMKILPILPYTHYFHSGLFGSGVCIFSKHLIYETLHHRFTLNGQPQKVFQSDWFCGKSVGLAKIQVNDLRVNVYGAHLHAQYSEPDDNEAHRAVQSYEMSQFIQHTSDGCDLVLVGGDFNFNNHQLGYRVIRHAANLDDAWLARREKPHSEDNELTCDRPDNPYTPASIRQTGTDGVRLDYIMFRQNSGIDITCEKCYLTMRQVPDQPYHYSDHEGVAAVFTVRRNVTAMGKRRECGEIEKHLGETLQVLDSGLKKVKSSRVFYIATMLLSIIALMFTHGVELPAGLNLLLSVGRLLVFLYGAVCAWMTVVVTNFELNALVAAKKDINNTLKSLSLYG